MSQSKSVLLVDDSKFARLLVKAFISSNFSDWKIDEAIDAQDALRQIDANSYDYFFIDFNMPGTDGLTLGKELRETYPASQIALLTANIQTEIETDAKSSGMDFLPKPPTEQKIVEYIRLKEATL